MSTTSDRMLPFLVDLESSYLPDVDRRYDPVDLVAYALAWPGSDYWPALALGWLEQGVARDSLGDRLLAFENDKNRSRALRLRARRLRNR